MMPFIQHSEKNKTGHRLGFPGAGEGKGAGGGWGGEDWNKEGKSEGRRTSQEKEAPWNAEGPGE